AAQVARAHWELGGSGVVLAQPPPTSLDDLEPLIAGAVAEAEREGIRGQAVTPFVLALLHERSGGRTLAANRERVVANAGPAGAGAGAGGGGRAEAAREAGADGPEGGEPLEAEQRNVDRRAVYGSTEEEPEMHFL